MSLIIAGNEIIQRPTDCDRLFSLLFPSIHYYKNRNNPSALFHSPQLSHRYVTRSFGERSEADNITPAFSIRSITTFHNPVSLVLRVVSLPSFLYLSAYDMHTLPFRSPLTGLLSIPL